MRNEKEENRLFYMNKDSLWYKPYDNVKIVDEQVTSYSELTRNQAAFLCALLKEKAPKKVLEVGTSAGGSTSIMIESIKDLGMLNDTTIYTVDLSRNYYRDHKKEVGFVARDYADQQDYRKLNIISGHLLVDTIEKIGAGIDFCFLDAAHVTPGEMLDFLTVWPFLDENAYVVLHDISFMHKYQGAQNIATATALLFSALGGVKQIYLDEKGYTGNYPNIGAVKCNKDTKSNLLNVFLALMVKWDYMPSDVEIASFRNLFTKYYNKDLTDLFEMALILNVHSRVESNRNQKGMERLIKKILRIATK